MLISNSLQKIVVLGTGGTIAGRSALRNDNMNYTAAQMGIESLVQDIEGLSEHVKGYHLEFEQVAQIDSKDMTPQVWTRLARRAAQALSQQDVKGIVITHGTDTLEETAFFLQLVLESHKPVVLTCAMRPATALSPDGPQNLLDALTVVMTPQAHGVMVICAGVVHAPAFVQKIHPYRLDAFSSGEYGALGWVRAAQLQWAVPGGIQFLPKWDISSWPESHPWPQVEIVLNHVGASGQVVDALVKAGVQGIVAAGTGNATLSESLEDALHRAVARGVKVVLSTRCSLGPLIPTRDAGFPVAPEHSAVKARVALQLALMQLPARE